MSKSVKGLLTFRIYEEDKKWLKKIFGSYQLFFDTMLVDAKDRFFKKSDAAHVIKELPVETKLEHKLKMLKRRERKKRA